MTVNSAVPELTTSPRLTSRLDTTPVSGARITASPSWRSAAASRDFMSATCASTVATLACARSRSLAASAPALTSCSVRATSRCASASWLSAERRAETADWRASSSVRVSMRPITAPCLVSCPSSTSTAVIDPPSSARTVASRAGRSSPETIGPVTIRPDSTLTTFSCPICTAAGAAAAAGASGSPPQPANTLPASTTTPTPRTLVPTLSRPRWRRARLRRRVLKLALLRRLGHRCRLRCRRRAAARAGRASGSSDRQVGQQRRPRPRHLQVARGQRAIGLGLPRQQQRIGQLELRREAGLVPHLRYLVGTHCLLHGARRGRPRSARCHQLRPRRTRVERGQLLDLPQLDARALHVGPGHHLVALLAPTGQEGHGHGRADRPVGPIERRQEHFRIRYPAVVRRQAHARPSLGLHSDERRLPRLHGRLCLGHCVAIGQR